jgi:hypothetical protein
LRLQSLPRCRAAPGASARAAAVLGWCSPQSSVPRQTVGHHARAATYEMGLKQRPAKAAAERCLGEPRQPPRRSFLFLLSHIPTGQGAVGRTARRALGWISQSRKTRFVCVLQKMGSRARARQRGRSRTRRRHRTDRASADRLARLPLAALPACLLPSRIPTGQGAVARAARRALGWTSRSRKTRFVCVLQKRGSRARAPAGEPGGPQGPRTAAPPASRGPVSPARPTLEPRPAHPRAPRHMPATYPAPPTLEPPFYPRLCLSVNHLLPYPTSFLYPPGLQP